ncbi:hypothetical protein CSB09_04790 [Candidatus Gracilibacteria bacterium]|nr:MAG: hypothetical protein CSB09_04790 [Candidatus Gracilibacteria bacterium]
MELINYSSLFIQTINIAIVIFVLWKFLFVPYLAFLDKEAKKRETLEKNTKESDTILKQAQKEAKSIVDASRSDAKQVAQEIVENAKKEAVQITQKASDEAEVTRKQAASDIENERKLIARELKQKVLDIALKMNANLFGKDEANAKFLKQSSQDIHL